MQRGECSFTEKAKKAHENGAKENFKEYLSHLLRPVLNFRDESLIMIHKQP